MNVKRRLNVRHLVDWGEVGLLPVISVFNNLNSFCVSNNVASDRHHTSRHGNSDLNLAVQT